MVDRFFQFGVSIIGGHTGYSTGLSRPLVAVTALGLVSGGRQPVLTNGAQIGDHVLVTKGIALEGTAILAEDFAEVARKLGLNEQEIEAGRQVMAEISVVPEALALADQGATAMHDVTRGGLLETLLEIAYLSQVGLRVDFSQLPIPAIVSRFAQAFRFDPLRMISSGTLAVTVPPARVADARQALAALATPFAFVGRVTAGSGVHIVGDTKARHFTEIRCEEDELARMWTLYPRDC